MEKNEITKIVLEWANDRNLCHKENALKQFGKLLEETNELYNSMISKNEIEIKDALGDIGIVMIILSNQLGYDFFECIELAYNVIKERKGKTINGIFVKD
jgi:NTP pyrophosphatase (non-canonical NTP hydrolase)